MTLCVCPTACSPVSQPCSWHASESVHEHHPNHCLSAGCHAFCSSGRLLRHILFTVGLEGWWQVDKDVADQPACLPVLMMCYLLLMCGVVPHLVREPLVPLSSPMDTFRAHGVEFVLLLACHRACVQGVILLPPLEGGCLMSLSMSMCSGTMCIPLGHTQHVPSGQTNLGQVSHLPKVPAGLPAVWLTQR